MNEYTQLIKQDSIYIKKSNLFNKTKNYLYIIISPFNKFLLVFLIFTILIFSLIIIIIKEIKIKIKIKIKEEYQDKEKIPMNNISYNN